MAWKLCTVVVFQIVNFKSYQPSAFQDELSRGWRLPFEGKVYHVTVSVNEDIGDPWKIGQFGCNLM